MKKIFNIENIIAFIFIVICGILMVIMSCK